MNKVFYIITGVIFTALAKILAFAIPIFMFKYDYLPSNYTSFFSCIIFYCIELVGIGYVIALRDARKGFSKMSTLINLILAVTVYLALEAFLITSDLIDIILMKIENTLGFIFLQLGIFIYKIKNRKVST